MNRRCFVFSAFGCAGGLSTASRSLAQNRVIHPDLATLAAGNGFKSFNRTVTSLNHSSRNGAHLNDAPGDGVAYLEGIEFSNGTIECDVRGKDVPQQSFVGIAFHGVDQVTYDAVYFRPFNFRAEDVARRVRAVQYISHPAWPWQKLRTGHSGKYEQAVSPPPDPDDWFHVRVIIASPRVSVFVQDAREPTLSVTQLSERRKGLIGLWVGNNSSGDFADLKLIPA